MSEDRDTGASIVSSAAASGPGGLAAMLLDILDALPFYVLLVDERHHVLLANNAVRSSFDVEPSALLGEHCPRVIHGQDAPYPGCPLEEALRTGQAATCEMHDAKSGRWLESAIYPTRHRTPAGLRVYFHLVRDISDRVQAEHERQALTARLEETLTRAISGFIPICSGCHKIRDDKGRWTAVEQFVGSRTGAEFSHGLCPACAARLYGMDALASRVSPAPSATGEGAPPDDAPGHGESKQARGRTGRRSKKR